jgi:hypothetical protein
MAQAALQYGRHPAHLKTSSSRDQATSKDQPNIEATLQPLIE